MGPSTEGSVGANHNMTRCLTLATLAWLRQELCLWLRSLEPQLPPERCLIAAA